MSLNQELKIGRNRERQIVANIDTSGASYRSSVVDDFKVRLKANVLLDWFWLLKVR